MREAPAPSATALTRPAVWAPVAARVDLHLGDQVLAMEATGGGWWTAPAAFPHGTDYAFAVDGGPPRPDPRSPWQPGGVHAASRTFDAAHHHWADSSWQGRDVRGAVTYELHVGTFTADGTLDAAIERLGHLVDLGIDVVELMPVAAFPGTNGWGYDGVALSAVHEPYGGPAALQRFVDAAHLRGLAVCLDVVYNHLGPSGNYLSEFGPYFTDAHHTPWGRAVNLDGPDAAEVRAFIIDDAVRWMRDFHVDALRLDAVHTLIDDSPRHLLAELSDTVEALAAEVGRPLSLVAESEVNDPLTVTGTADGGLGMTAQWADDVHHAMHALLTGERTGWFADFGPVEVLAKALTGVFVRDGGWSTYHGQNWGKPVPPDIDGHRFVAFASNHDQVGNRALGDRPSARLDPGGLAIEAALVLCSAFSPLIFMGEEWGARTPWLYFTDHAEPWLAEAIREGRARDFDGRGWVELYGGHVDVPDPQARSTVEASRLDWSEPDSPGHDRLLAWYRDLIALRRRVPDLASGDRGAVHVEHTDTWLVIHRGDTRVAANLSEDPARIPLGLGPATGTEVLAAWRPFSVHGTDADLPGHSVAIVRRRGGDPDPLER